MKICDLFLQGGLELELLGSHKMKLKDEFFFSLAVLPSSGDIMLQGQETSSSPLALHIFRLSDGGLQRRSVKNPCQDGLDDILGLMVEGQEMIAAACRYCRDVKLVDPQTRATARAYHNPQFPPYHLCLAELGKLWVSSYSEPYQAIKLNCEMRTFTQEEGGVIQLDTRPVYLCYLPGSPAALVCSGGFKVRAVSCRDGSNLWNVDGKVAGCNFNPLGLSVHSGVILVADYNNHRIVVLSPAGSVLQSIHLPKQVQNPKALCWSKDQLAVLSGYGPDSRLSFFKVSQSVTASAPLLKNWNELPLASWSFLEATEGVKCFPAMFPNPRHDKLIYYLSSISGPTQSFDDCVLLYHSERTPWWPFFLSVSHKATPIPLETKHPQKQDPSCPLHLPRTKCWALMWDFNVFEMRLCGFVNLWTEHVLV